LFSKIWLQGRLHICAQGHYRCDRVFQARSVTRELPMNRRDGIHCASPFHHHGSSRLYAIARVPGRPRNLRGLLRKATFLTTRVYVRFAPILLQKSFCVTEYKFPACRHGDRIIMWGPHQLAMNSRATSGSALEDTSIGDRHCSSFCDKLVARHFWDFCNKSADSRHSQEVGLTRSRSRRPRRSEPPTRSTSLRIRGSGVRNLFGARQVLRNLVLTRWPPQGGFPRYSLWCPPVRTCEHHV